MAPVGVCMVARALAGLALASRSWAVRKAPLVRLGACQRRGGAYVWVPSLGGQDQGLGGWSE